MKINILKKIILYISSFLITLLNTNIFIYGTKTYTGIVCNESLIRLIEKRINMDKVRQSYGKSDISVDFSKIYGKTESDNLLRLDFVIPVNYAGNIVGEITSTLSMSVGCNCINMIPFFESKKLDLLENIRIHFEKMMVKFFMFSVNPTRYIPSIVKTKRPQKTNVIKKYVTNFWNSGYSPLKEKTD